MLPFKIVSKSGYDQQVRACALKLMKEAADVQIKALVEEGIETIIAERVQKIIKDAEFLDEQREAVDVYIDFNAQNFKVFSIERAEIGTTNERTIIGYTRDTSTGRVNEEWVMYISRKSHNELVREYKNKTS